MPGQSIARAGANQDGISLLALAAANASSNGADQSNLYSRGVTVVVDITAISGAGATLVVTIEGKDPVSGKYYTILASVGLTAIGTTVLKVYPDLTAAANVAINAPLPKTWRVKTTITGTTPAITATVGAALSI